MNFILTFICGAVYEITSVYWLFSTQHLKPFRAAFWSMVQATVMLTGIAESINDRSSALCFVCGYGFGTGIAVFIDNRINPGGER